MENINKILQTLRLKKGLTMKQVAEAAQVPLSTYREWEYGRAIQGEPYIKLACVFSVSLSELLTGYNRTQAAWRDMEKIEDQIKNLRLVLSSSS